MHSPGEKRDNYTLDEAADAVLAAFVDSFVTVNGASIPPDAWLRRLINELEAARDDIMASLERTTSRKYKSNLSRCIRRVENVLAQLYEEQLHH